MKPMQAMIPTKKPSMKLRTPGLIDPPHRETAPCAPLEPGGGTLCPLIDMDVFSVSTRRTAATAVLVGWMVTSAACLPLGRTTGGPVQARRTPPALVDDGDRAPLVAAVRESARYYE